MMEEGHGQGNGWKEREAEEADNTGFHRVGGWTASTLVVPDVVMMD